MKWVIKEKSLPKLINFVRENLNSENYIFITTNEIFTEQKDNFEIFCKKIPSNYEVHCVIEKTIKSFKSAFVVFIIKNEFILEKELELFDLVLEKPLLPLVTIVNNIDYEYHPDNNSNRSELGWFLRKIFGHVVEPKNYFAKEDVTGNISEQNVRGIAISSTIVRWDPPMKGQRPSAFFFQHQSLQDQYGNPREFNESKSLISISQKLDPDFFYTYHDLGIHYFQNGSYAPALDNFKKSLEKNPKFSASTKMVAQCYFALGRTSLAISELEQIDFEEYPDREKFDLKLTLAIYKTFTQDYDEAIILFEEINYLRVHSKDLRLDGISSLFVNWISCLQKINSFPDTVRVLKLALKEMPSVHHQTAQYGVFAHDLAKLYMELEQIDNAIDVCNDALEKNEKNWPVLFLLGLCQLSKNESKNALNSLSLAKSFLEKESPFEFTKYWLNKITNLLETLKIGIDEVQTREIPTKIIKETSNHVESAWETQLRAMGAVALTSSKKENDQIAITKLSQCEGYLFWVDPYFEKPGFTWLSEAYVMNNSSIKKIEILARFQEFSPKEDLYKTEFKESFNVLKNELNKKNITLELRICFDSKYAKNIHSRYWYFYKIPPPEIISQWAIPSIMNFKRGQNESINPTVYPKENFNEIWAHSLNFEIDYDEIISNYEEWRKKQKNES